jgi:hypothetical protein
MGGALHLYTGSGLRAAGWLGGWASGGYDIHVPACCQVCRLAQQNETAEKDYLHRICYDVNPPDPKVTVNRATAAASMSPSHI